MHPVFAAACEHTAATLRHKRDVCRARRDIGWHDKGALLATPSPLTTSSCASVIALSSDSRLQHALRRQGRGGIHRAASNSKPHDATNATSKTTELLGNLLLTS
jgi:hypothetical protein